MPADVPSGQNQAYYRIAFDLGPDGRPAGFDAADPALGWSSLLGVDNWFSWDNQYGALAVADLGGALQLLVMSVDHPPNGNAGFYALVPLVETASAHGRWDPLPFDSEILPIHAALLHTGRILFFAGSGNNPTRAADPRFGDVTQRTWTSVVWDPSAPPGANFDHPPTIRRGDGRPFDFFCGGDTFLADGRLLTAGGNQAYDGGNNTGQREAASFDPATQRWTNRASMAAGRWYPTLLPLADGRVLAVSGKDEHANPNDRFEVYDPAADRWQDRPAPPGGPDFLGLPFYAHLFLLQDGRIFFSGGRMDDDRQQPAGLLELRAGATTFEPVPMNVLTSLRNQSSSVLLPRAQDQEVMIIGGGPKDDLTAATGSTERIKLTDRNPAYRLAMPLSLPRIHLNAVLLPDRTVFVCGGAILHEEEGARRVPRLQSEIYDPVLDRWKPGATARVERMYHSVALLLPDGRVVTADGNPPPGGRLAQYVEQEGEELKLEVYSPPYLFAGPRPAITAAPPEWRYGQAVAIGTPQAGSVRWAELIRNDNSQRLVDLPISSRNPNRIQVRTPAGPALAPPGWYMLFLVDQAGVPSVGSWIHLTA